jgi:hypothetical protein
LPHNLETEAMTKTKPTMPPVTDVTDARKALLTVERCQRLLEGLSPESQRWVVHMLEHGRPIVDDEDGTP